MNYFHRLKSHMAICETVSPLKFKKSVIRKMYCVLVLCTMRSINVLLLKAFQLNLDYYHICSSKPMQQVTWTSSAQPVMKFVRACLCSVIMLPSTRILSPVPAAPADSQPIPRSRFMSASSFSVMGVRRSLRNLWTSKSMWVPHIRMQSTSVTSVPFPL